MDAIASHQNVKEVEQLLQKGVRLSEQAHHLITHSQHFDELGRTIFLDRYSLKAKRDEIFAGDFVIVVTKEDHKFPKKDLGVITAVHPDGRATMHMLTG